MQTREIKSIAAPTGSCHLRRFPDVATSGNDPKEKLDVCPNEHVLGLNVRT